MTKRHYLILNLIIIAAAFYIGMGIFKKITASNITHVDPNDSVLPQTHEIKQEKKLPLSNYSVVTKRNLFGSLEKPLEGIKDEDIKGLELTSLNLRLLGTISCNNQQNARAIIEESGKRKQEIYKVGDSIQEALVKGILREKVVLKVGDKDEILTMEEPASRIGRNRSSYSRQTRKDISRSSSRRTSTRATPVTVRRKDIQEALSNLDALQTQARITPHNKNGKTDGLSLSRIKRGSIFSKLRLRNGDILQKINHKDLTSMEDLASFYESLTSDSEPSLQISRRGRSKTFNYKLK